MLKHAQHHLENIHARAPAAPLRIMNVCGGHERAIAQAGLRSLLPDTLQLIPGPGCPVCVCPEEDLYQVIHWALHEAVTVVSFGDMLRVPVNVRRGEVRSLEEARACGADIRAIAAPQDALRIARADPQRRVLFHAVGFETTLAPIAALIAEGVPANLLFLISGRRTWPAVALLLEAADASLDALIAPGHVATVMGAAEWEFVADKHRIPTAIAGFTPDSLLAAIDALLQQVAEQQARTVNCYALAVKPQGNPVAQRLLNQCLVVVDANWRGIGVIPQSGYALRPAYQAHDVRQHLPLLERAPSGMPAACDCAAVVLGKIVPSSCRIYGAPCTPRTPIGPCMVSEEGACRIWWAAGIRERT